MALVFHRTVAVPVSAIAFFAVALTAPPPTKTLFLMPPPTLFVIATVGIAALMFWMSGAIPWLRTSRLVACVRPSGHRDHASAAITLVAGNCVGAIEEPNRREADDALDLVRMDDDGGWQMTGPPA